MNSSSRNMDRDRKESLAKAAGLWDARLRGAVCTDEDRKEFAAWRDADPAHREAFERLQAIVSRLRQERSRADLRAMRDAALALTDRRQKRMRWTAAASVAAVALALLLWTLAPQIAGIGWARASTFSTGTGQRSTVTLQDGSTVELNSKTRIRVAFSGKRRSVVLLEGQAIFQVAKDVQRPFVVQAGDREIVAVGTAFDVRLDSSAVRVTLLEGKVAVTPQGGVAALELPLPVLSPAAEPIEGRHAKVRSISHERRERSDTVYLSPGQQLVANRNVDESASVTTPPSLREIDVEKVTSWREGRVFIEDMTLIQAIAEMNKHSAVQIVLGDQSLEALRINGMFRAGDNEAFAHALETYFHFPIVAERRSETQILLKERR
jgi:transmembrane sensor